jgi:adenylate cyclase
MAERQAGPSGLSPTAAIIVTRVRRAPVRTTRATVLFADLRGYMGMAERLPAARVVPLLDEFLGALAFAVETCGGRVFHMAGDGMMAGFGVDGESGHGASQALAAGHTMLRDFSPIAARWRSELSIDSAIGVGLHEGEVAVGVLGPSHHRATTLVGDTVNVAARLCGRARAGEVLFSSTVAASLDENSSAAAPGLPPFLQLPQFELRGRRSRIDIWCVPALKRLAL